MTKKAGKKADKKAEGGSNGGTRTVAGRTVRPLDISAVESVPIVRRENGLTKQALAALGEAGVGSYRLREYGSWSSASAFAHNMAKAAKANGIANMRFVTRQKVVYAEVTKEE